MIVPVDGTDGKDLLFDRLIKNSKVNPSTGCLEWQKGRTEKSYGSIIISDKPKGTLKRAHRLMWEIKNGPIPDGVCVCHRCDNPPCINLLHLFLATNHDNQLDSNGGERNVTSKLKDSNIVQIRKMIENGKSDKDISFLFDVSPGTIGFVRSGKTWKHVL